MNYVSHFEIPVKDVDKSRKFYARLFDWEFQPMKDMDYLMVTTKNEEGEAAGTAGILLKENDQHVITNYINVKDIDIQLGKIEASGGKIVLPKTPVPGMGWFAHFTDPDDNVLAIWQDDREAN